MNTETPQLEMDFSSEEEKLALVNSISELIEQIEGPLTPQHLQLLLERKTEHTLGRALSDNEKSVIQETVESEGSYSKIDPAELADHILKAA